MNTPKGFNCHEIPELNEFFLKLTDKFSDLVNEKDQYKLTFIGANIVQY